MTLIFVSPSHCVNIRDTQSYAHTNHSTVGRCWMRMGYRWCNDCGVSQMYSSRRLNSRTSKKDAGLIGSARRGKPNASRRGGPFGETWGYRFGYAAFREHL